MFEMIGPSALSGFAVIVVMSFVNFFLGKYSMECFKKIMGMRDNRVKCTNEIFG